MRYNPITCVWEVTMGCNMRCEHCGSSCKGPLPGELTTDEAFRLVDMMAKMNMSWVTLSGGEPLLRKDIYEIIQHFSDKGVDANVITNGWLIDKEIAGKLKKSNVSTVAISIDGPKEIHDRIRREGSFDQSKRAFEFLNEEGVYTASITTISRENIDYLDRIKRDLIDMGVKLWQVQLGLPMGNFANHKDWMISPYEIQPIIDFCYQTALEGKIRITPADCIGYYNSKLNSINYMGSLGIWEGCNAGLRSFGVLHNGDIVGCTSIRDKNFIEGNIREKSLIEIWEDPKSFSWRRNMIKSDLKGDCKLCRYGNECLGGCANTRITTQSSLNSENLYCSFNYLIKKLKNNLIKIYNVDLLFEKACNALRNERYQEAYLIFNRVLELDHGYKYVSILKSIAEYKCGDYKLDDIRSKKIFDKALSRLDINNIVESALKIHQKDVLKVGNV